MEQRGTLRDPKAQTNPQTQYRSRNFRVPEGAGLLPDKKYDFFLCCSGRGRCFHVYGERAYGVSTQPNTHLSHLRDKGAIAFVAARQMSLRSTAHTSLLARARESLNSVSRLR